MFQIFRNKKRFSKERSCDVEKKKTSILARFAKTRRMIFCIGCASSRGFTKWERIFGKTEFVLPDVLISTLPHCIYRIARHL
jgi:hypothetical protein